MSEVLKDATSVSLSPGITLKFIKGRSKLVAECENTVTVLEHVLVVEYKAIHNKLFKLLDEKTDLVDALNNVKTLNETLSKMRDTAYDAAYEQASLIDLYIKNLNKTLLKQDAN